MDRKCVFSIAQARQKFYLCPWFSAVLTWPYLGQQLRHANGSVLRLQRLSPDSGFRMTRISTSVRPLQGRQSEGSCGNMCAALVRVLPRNFQITQKSKPGYVST